MKITDASGLSDTALIAELSRLAGRERAATVALIVHLAEFDARRLYAGEGYSSTFRHCTDFLRLSEDAAWNRIEVARAARNHPLVLDMLLSGALSPTTARLLARRLTAQNRDGLLAEAAGKSRQQVEELLARRFPQPDVPSSIHPLSTTVSSPMNSSEIRAPVHEAPVLIAAPVDSRPELPRAAALSGITAAPRPLVRPLAADRYEIRFTASSDTRDYLRRAQDLLGHAIPSGDLDQVLNRALRLLVQDLERKKVAATDRPQRSRGQSEDSRNIPANVSGGCGSGMAIFAPGWLRAGAAAASGASSNTITTILMEWEASRPSIGSDSCAGRIMATRQRCSTVRAVATMAQTWRAKPSSGTPRARAGHPSWDG